MKHSTNLPSAVAQLLVGCCCAAVGHISRCCFLHSVDEEGYSWYHYVVLFCVVTSCAVCLQVNKGRVTIAAEVNSIYTLTTLKTGQKGIAKKIPLPADFPLPYKDNFDGSLTLTIFVSVSSYIWLFALTALTQLKRHLSFLACFQWLHLNASATSAYSLWCEKLQLEQLVKSRRIAETAINTKSCVICLLT